MQGANKGDLVSEFLVPVLVRVAIVRERLLGAGRDRRGQGTVEYVGLILLVSMLMVGMVAAMKGFKSPFS
jgi:hypothetical protein